MILCEICGNTLPAVDIICPYCGTSSTSPIIKEGRPFHRIVNLEKGFPSVDQALHRLDMELETAARQKVRVLTLIHGYGSSGKGGAIRASIRRQLEYYRHERKINDLLIGEQFSRRSGAGRQLLRRFPSLSTHKDLNKGNPGITLVVL